MKRLKDFSVLSAMLFSSLASWALPPKNIRFAQKLSSSTTQISFMEFNVENMFDTVHDVGTDDETFLPKSVKDASPEIQAKCAQQSTPYYQDECRNTDWSEAVLRTKLHNVASTILSVEAGMGADVLLMEEVENINVLNQLRDEHLTAAGYKTTVLIEGFDTRGIDVALMSRLPLRGKPQLHKIPYKALPTSPNDQAAMGKSRGILEVPLTLPDGSPMTVFVLHFPSQNNPDYWREQAVNYLVELLKQHQGELTVAGGDFNISGPEEAKAQLFHKTLASVGQVTHVVGCQECQGSYYHQKQFEFIDAMIFTGTFLKDTSPWKLDIPSIMVANQNPLHRTPQGTPLHFDPVTQTGVSDHFPMFARIVKTSAH